VSMSPRSIDLIEQPLRELPNSRLGLATLRGVKARERCRGASCGAAGR
jgi:hypothetical protein